MSDKIKPSLGQPKCGRSGLKNLEVLSLFTVFHWQQFQDFDSWPVHVKGDCCLTLDMLQADQICLELTTPRCATADSIGPFM